MWTSGPILGDFRAETSPPEFMVEPAILGRKVLTKRAKGYGNVFGASRENPGACLCDCFTFPFFSLVC